MGSLYQEFVSILIQYLPNADKSFGKNTNTAVLNEINAIVKNKLPEDFINFYSEVNGEENPIGSILGFTLMPLEQIRMEYDHLCNSSYPLNITSHSEGVIQEGKYNSMWIPIASDAGGSFFALDLDPGVNGVIGQIITIDHESDISYVVANSFRELLMDVIPNELQGGNFDVDDEEEPEMFEWTSGHYFNDIKDRNKL